MRTISRNNKPVTYSVAYTSKKIYLTSVADWWPSVHIFYYSNFRFCNLKSEVTMMTAMFFTAVLCLFLVASSAWVNPSANVKLRFQHALLETEEPVPLTQGHRMTRKLRFDKDKLASVVSRTVPISEFWNITVWEWEKPAAVVETYWQVEQQGLTLTNGYERQRVLDPFGLVTWPGSVIAAQELFEYKEVLKDKRVLILGAGVGIEAQAAAMLGAESVLATDIHPTTLQLLQYGAHQAGLDHIISTEALDICSIEPLPECDILIVADVLYNEKLAAHVVRRIVEARKFQNSPLVLVSDSQRFVAGFQDELNEKLQTIGDNPVQWVSRWLPSFTGSGVLIDQDQTYDVRARVIWLGLDDYLGEVQIPL